MCKGPRPGALLLLGAPLWVVYTAARFRDNQPSPAARQIAYSLGRGAGRRIDRLTWRGAVIGLAVIAALCTAIALLQPQQQNAHVITVCTTHRPPAFCQAMEKNP